MYNVYAGILKMSDVFHDDGKEIEIKYILNENRMELCEKYHIDKVAGNNGDFQKAENLLIWLSANTYHRGDYDNHIHPDALSLLDYSFKNPQKGINCTALSIILSQCLAALGMKSRVLRLVPYSPYDVDCHVVCETYVTELKKWIMLDPTFGTYVTDENNMPLSVWEIRTRLADKKEIRFFEKAHYNNSEFSVKETTEYYAKDMYIIELNEIQGAFSESPLVISIVPLGFDIKKRENISAKFIMEQIGNLEWIVKMLDGLENKTFVCKDTSILK